MAMVTIVDTPRSAEAIMQIGFAPRAHHFIHPDRASTLPKPMRLDVAAAKHAQASAYNLCRDVVVGEVIVTNGAPLPMIINFKPSARCGGGVASQAIHGKRCSCCCCTIQTCAVCRCRCTRGCRASDSCILFMLTIVGPPRFMRTMAQVSFGPCTQRVVQPNHANAVTIWVRLYDFAAREPQLSAHNLSPQIIVAEIIIAHCAPLAIVIDLNSSCTG